MISFSWNYPSIGWLTFLALIPLFLGIEIIKNLSKRRFLILSIYFFLFLLISTSFNSAWLIDSALQSYLISVILYSLISFLIFLPSIFFLSSNYKFTYFFLVLNWVLFEFSCQNTDFLTPFYMLGNSLGQFPMLIQNYKYIGIEGGSLWILMTNLFLFFAIISFKSKKIFIQNIFKGSLIFIIPLGVSLVLYSVKEEKSRQIKVAALHTNIDQIDESYRIDPMLMSDTLWSLSKNIDIETELLLWPETIITNLGWTHEFHSNTILKELYEKIKDYPKLSLNFGANVYSMADDITDPNLNYNDELDMYYYTHNVSFSIKSDGTWGLRSKKKFIMFQEEVPFLNIFPKLKDIMKIVGNTNIYSYYPYGKEMLRTLSNLNYTPVICYEACNSSFISQIATDNHFLAINANEYWNKSKKGSQLYLNLLPGFAIQSGIAIVKSSNGGISCIVNKKGEILKARSFGNTGLIQGEINLKTNMTFYDSIRGYTYILSLLLFILYLLATMLNHRSFKL